MGGRRQYGVLASGGQIGLSPTRLNLGIPQSSHRSPRDERMRSKLPRSWKTHKLQGN